MRELNIRKKKIYREKNKSGEEKHGHYVRMKNIIRTQTIKMKKKKDILDLNLYI